MNIIQKEDNLKGMSDQALANLYENPTGEYPLYLVISEFGRRNDIRKAYEAEKGPQQTVADQIVAEAMPQGIGTLMATGMEPPQQGVGTPQAMPEMTPEMLASSGVAALPTGDVGTNYAGGGIIAFQDRGYVKPRVTPIYPGHEFYDPVYDYEIEKIIEEKKKQEDIINQLDKERDTSNIPSILRAEPRVDVEDVRTEVAQELDPQPGGYEYTKEDVVKADLTETPPPAITEEEGKEILEVQKKAEQGKPLTDEERAKWMLGAEIGFGMMATKRPDFFGAVGEAGMAAAPGFAARMKDIKDRQAVAAKTLADATQKAVENKLDIEKLAREYVEGVHGKPSEIDDAEKIQTRNNAYQAKKIELLYEYGYLTDKQAMESLNTLGLNSADQTGTDGFKIRNVRR